MIFHSLSATQCLQQPVTGFLALKNLEEHKQIRFSWLPIFSIAERGFGELCFLTFRACFWMWKVLVQILHLVLDLQHFGSSFLDPLLYFRYNTVHTSNLLSVTAMLSVAKTAYTFVSEEKHFSTIAWQSHTFCRWGFVFGRQPDVGGFLWKPFFLDVVVLHFSPRLMFLS